MNKSEHGHIPNAPKFIRECGSERGSGPGGADDL